MGLHELDTQMYVGQKAFVNRGGKILVLKDDIGLDFPGGKFRWGEDLIESLQRETEEETRLKIKVGEPFFTWTNKGVPGVKVNIFYVGYMCEYVNGEVELSDEHFEYEWVDASTFKKCKDSTGHYKALEKYFQLQTLKSTTNQV